MHALASHWAVIAIAIALGLTFVALAIWRAATGRWWFPTRDEMQAWLRVREEKLLADIDKNREFSAREIARSNDIKARLDALRESSQQRKVRIQEARAAAKRTKARSRELRSRLGPSRSSDQ